MTPDARRRSLYLAPRETSTYRVPLTEAPPWRVLLLGGASGVGKTKVSYRLAHHFGVGLTETDDFQVVLERVTTPDQYPVVHMWRLQPEKVLALDDAGMLEHFRDYCAVMAHVLEPVIANHIEENTPVVLEGGFILPSLASLRTYGDVDAGGHVRALFIYEDDETQLARNFRAREGEEQPRRASISLNQSEWLRAECERLGVPAVPARPWDTVLERAISAVS